MYRAINTLGDHHVAMNYCKAKTSIGRSADAVYPSIWAVSVSLEPICGFFLEAVRYKGK
jgi:hypothetical protein